MHYFTSHPIDQNIGRTQSQVTLGNVDFVEIVAHAD